jgi:hypothetical protein
MSRGVRGMSDIRDWQAPIGLAIIMQGRQVSRERHEACIAGYVRRELSIAENRENMVGMSATPLIECLVISNKSPITGIKA